MNNSLVQKKAKGEKLVLPLTTAAIGFYLVNFVSCFFTYEEVKEYSYFSSEYAYTYELTALPIGGIVINIFNRLLVLAPLVLLVILLYKKKTKDKTLCICCIVAFGLNVALDVVSLVFGVNFISNLFLIAFGLISIMNVIEDFKNKIFIFSAPIFLAIKSVWDLIDSLNSIKSFIETERDIYILSVFSALALLLFSVVLFVLSMPLYKAVEENQRLYKTIGLKKNMPAIEALPLLNEALENGTITQEQYQTKRAEILSKL